MTSEIYERLKIVCKENNTNPTALCIEITGSQGNLATWKKGNIRTDYLIKIAQKFNVSIDYLLLPSIDSKEIQYARQALKNWLDITDVTIPEIEKTTGTNYATVKVWSCGFGNYFNDKIFILADLLNCSIDELLGRTDVPTILSKQKPTQYTEIAAFGGAETEGTQPPIDEETT